MNHQQSKVDNLRESIEQSPSKIEHLVDADVDPSTGECTHYYNYLKYTFDCPEGIVIARSYLDTTSEVALIDCPFQDNSEGKLKGILAYLRLRYPIVKRFGKNGYFEI